MTSHSEAGIYRVVPALEGLGFLDATYERHAFAPHAHDTYVVGLVERGSAVVRGADSSVIISPRNLLLIPPHVIHSAWGIDSPAWSYRAIYPSKSVIARLLGSDGEAMIGAASEPMVIEECTVVETAHAMFDTVSAVGAEFDEVTVAKGLDIIFDSVLQRLPREESKSSAHPGAERARRYIDENPTTMPDLHLLAEIAGLSVFHFVRAFARRFGVTPYAYFLQRRVAETQRLLVQGVPASQVAQLCGFSDQSHLIRQFRRVVGVTPRRFVAGTRVAS